MLYILINYYTKKKRKLNTNKPIYKYYISMDTIKPVPVYAYSSKKRLNIGLSVRLHIIL